MKLTGVVAQIFMVWWDKEFEKKLQDVNKQLKLHERYVDDTNLVGKQTEPGARLTQTQKNPGMRMRESHPTRGR